MFDASAADITEDWLRSSSATGLQKHCEWSLMAMNIALSLIEKASDHNIEVQQGQPKVHTKFFASLAVFEPVCMFSPLAWVDRSGQYLRMLVADSRTGSMCRTVCGCGNTRSVVPLNMSRRRQVACRISTIHSKPIASNLSCSYCEYN